MADTIHVHHDGMYHVAYTDTNGAIFEHALCGQCIDETTWIVGKGDAQPCLACIRQMHGLTLEEFSEAVGYSASYLGDIERGRRDITESVRKALNEVYK